MPLRARDAKRLELALTRVAVNDEFGESRGKVALERARFCFRVDASVTGHARISRVAQVWLVDAPLARGDVMPRIIAEVSGGHTGSVAHDAGLLVAVEHRVSAQPAR